MKRKYLAGLALVLILFAVGCAMKSTVLKPQQDLLTRFESFYMAQFNDYQIQVAQSNLTEAQKNVLRQKREVLVKAQPLITAYGALVMQGGTPSVAQEQTIIQLLNSIGGGF